MLDPCNIRIDSKLITISTIIDKIDNNMLIFPSSVNRMSIIESSRLIESMCVRIPLPIFYLDEYINGIWLIVDGARRFYAIYYYVENNYELEGLELLAELEGLRYKDIPPYLVRRIIETVVRVQVILSCVTKDIKASITNRIRYLGHIETSYDLRDRMEYLGLIDKEDNGA